PSRTRARRPPDRKRPRPKTANPAPARWPPRYMFVSRAGAARPFSGLRIPMPSDIDVSSLPAPAQKLLGPGAPLPMRLMAARGIVPGLKPADIVQVLCVLAESDDPEIHKLANATLDALPPPILTGALNGDLPASAIDRIARAHPNHHDVLAALLRMPRARRDGSGEIGRAHRLNSSHVKSSYAVFCLKKKNTIRSNTPPQG